MNKKFSHISALVLLYSGIYGCVQAQKINKISSEVTTIKKRLAILSSEDSSAYKGKLSLVQMQKEIEGINQKLKDLKKIGTILSNQAKGQEIFEEYIRQIQGLRGITEEIQVGLAEIKKELQRVQNNFLNKEKLSSLFAGLTDSIEKINVNIGRIQELNEISLEEESMRNSSIADTTNKRVDLVEQKISDLIAVFKGSMPKGIRKKKEGKSTPIKTKVPELISSESYKSAYNYYLNGEYPKAIENFKRYINANPHTRLSDNAQYWLADSYYNSNGFEQAVEEFKKVVDNYSDSDKAPLAMLKIGYALERISRKEDSVQILKKLAERYPNSEAAKYAKQKLADYPKE